MYMLQGRLFQNKCFPKWLVKPQGAASYNDTHTAARGVCNLVYITKMGCENKVISLPRVKTNVKILTHV